MLMKFFMGVEEKNRRFGGKIKEILYFFALSIAFLKKHL